MSMEQNPPFCSQVRASGLAEVWTHSHDESKFGQFGWRCTTKENSYSEKSLVGNWNEQRFDINHQKIAKRLPSQNEHYFDNTYGTSYNNRPQEVPQALKHMTERSANAHPAHQPELDSSSLQGVYNSWETTSRSSFMDPKLRTGTVDLTPPRGAPPAQ